MFLQEQNGPARDAAARAAGAAASQSRARERSDRGAAAIAVAATALRKRDVAAAAAPRRDGGSGGGLTIDGVVALPDTATLNCIGWMTAMAKIGRATQISRDSSK